MKVHQQRIAGELCAIVPPYKRTVNLSQHEFRDRPTLYLEFKKCISDY